MTVRERPVMDTYSLSRVTAEQIELARSATNGRAATTLHGGRGATLRQTVLALTARHGLADHKAPGEATLQVHLGRVRLIAAEESFEAGVGEYLVIPARSHSLEAIEDSVVLLTVAITDQP
jgi:quercetin dioxygenase-like cupin family protein